MKDVDAVPTLVLRRVVSGPDRATFVPDACGAIWGLLQGRGLRGGHNIAFYPDADTVEAGVEFNGEFPAGEALRSGLPGGRAAYTVHRGPYGSLGEAHRAVHEWSKQAGQPLAGPSWEVYGHWREQWNTDPSLIETEVYWLLR